MRELKKVRFEFHGECPQCPFYEIDVDVMCKDYCKTEHVHKMIKTVNIDTHSFEGKITSVQQLSRCECGYEKWNEI